MIIAERDEILTNGHGTSGVDTCRMEELALEDREFWQDIDISPSDVSAIALTEDEKISFPGGEPSDITEYAFSQLCSKTGIPAGYIHKCLKHGKRDLAVTNFNAWAGEEKPHGYRFRIHKGAIRGVLTDRYNLYSNHSVLHALNQAFPRGGSAYVPNQAFLSPDRLHIRYVDFDNPIEAGGERLNCGFTVNSSDIGKSSLNVRYFLYRFACKNGMVISRYGGTLFRMTHLADFEGVGSDVFLDAIGEIDHISNDIIRPHMESAIGKRLTNEEIEILLSRAQSDLHVGKEGAGRILDIMYANYSPTLWGFINSITENAQSFTLEKRMNMESWAGAQLLAA